MPARRATLPTAFAPRRQGGGAKLAALAATGIAAAALANHLLAKGAERRHPPRGRFLEIGDVRLHYVERGAGTPLVLLHGNGGMIEDFLASGLIARAAQRYRVIVFDRPGYGHSGRPRNRIWTDRAQASLVAEALTRLGVERALVLGHSWGCAVAVRLALAAPARVAGLVLLSGYYYPTARGDVLGLALAATPLLGDVLRHSFLPPLLRAIWPALLRRIFAPEPVPLPFAAFPKAMAVRPSQLRASAAECALMIPDAWARRRHYRGLALPVTILAGADDPLVDTETQSARLHRDIAGSRYRRLPGAGHMIHHTAADEVMAAIDGLAASLKA